MPLILQREYVEFIDSWWRFSYKKVVGNNQFNVYMNLKLIGLMKISMLQISPPMYGGYIWCTRSEALSLALPAAFTDMYNSISLEPRFTQLARIIISDWIVAHPGEKEHNHDPDPEPDPIS
ncbi:hypothetical protein LCGC14_1797790, partial [marine sediment metagenome]